MTKQGDPIWADFGSTDFIACKAFYQQLFGWNLTDSGEAMAHYHMIDKDGDLVAGGMSVAGMTGPTGEPIASSWTVYLATDDLDATFERAVKAGATEIVPPMDAGNAGRHAVVLDPTGAELGLWQGTEITGFVCNGKPGTPAWFELMTQDYDMATAFYTEVFGVDLVSMPMDDESFRYATNGDDQTATFGIGDAVGVIPAEAGSYWRPYYIVDGCDAAVERVRELGGTVLDGAVDSPFGRIATVADPAGASLQIISPTEAVPDN